MSKAGIVNPHSQERILDRFEKMADAEILELCKKNIKEARALMRCSNIDLLSAIGKERWPEEKIRLMRESYVKLKRTLENETNKDEEYHHAIKYLGKMEQAEEAILKTYVRDIRKAIKKFRSLELTEAALDGDENNSNNDSAKNNSAVATETKDIDRKNCDDAKDATITDDNDVKMDDVDSEIMKLNNKSSSVAKNTTVTQITNNNNKEEEEEEEEEESINEEEQLDRRAASPAWTEIVEEIIEDVYLPRAVLKPEHQVGKTVMVNYEGDLYPARIMRVFEVDAKEILDEMECVKCNTGMNEHFLLLCSRCDGAWHTYCLNPPQWRIPDGDWFCDFCVKEAQKEEKKKNKAVNSSKKKSKDDGVTATAAHEKEGKNEEKGGEEEIAEAPRDLEIPVPQFSTYFRFDMHFYGWAPSYDLWRLESDIIPLDQIDYSRVKPPASPTQTVMEFFRELGVNLDDLKRRIRAERRAKDSHRRKSLQDASNNNIGSDDDDDEIFKVQAGHCDICGHNKAELECATCHSYFHPRCLHLKLGANFVPGSWQCHMCKASERLSLKPRAIEPPLDAQPDAAASQPSSLPLSSSSSSTTVSSSLFAVSLEVMNDDNAFKLADSTVLDTEQQHDSGLVVSVDAQQPKQASVQISTGATSQQQLSTAETGRVMIHNNVLHNACAACGFVENEIIECRDCHRSFCCGCMCVNSFILRTISQWDCSECLGIRNYDAWLATVVEQARERLLSGKGNFKEADCFAQLLFDLFSNCVWDIFDDEKNLNTVLEISVRQFEHRFQPAVLPFHVLHYTTDLELIQKIAFAYSYGNVYGCFPRNTLASIGFTRKKKIEEDEDMGITVENNNNNNNNNNSNNNNDNNDNNNEPDLDTSMTSNLETEHNSNSISLVTSPLTVSPKKRKTRSPSSPSQSSTSSSKPAVVRGQNTRRRIRAHSSGDNKMTRGNSDSDVTKNNDNNNNNNNNSVDDDGDNDDEGSVHSESLQEDAAADLPDSENNNNNNNCNNKSDNNDNNSNSNNPQIDSQNSGDLMEISTTKDDEEQQQYAAAAASLSLVTPTSVTTPVKPKGKKGRPKKKENIGLDPNKQHTFMEVKKPLYQPEDNSNNISTDNQHTASNSRIKIGYISNDFVNHPTSDLVIATLVNHDKSKYNVFIYSLIESDMSQYRLTLEKEMEHFIYLKREWSDKKCAKIIAADGIQILINLNGHTAGDRSSIMRLRPAPIQMVFLGYPGTSGAHYIDYNVVDPIVCLQEHYQFMSETPFVMPYCYQSNSFSYLYKDTLLSPCKPTRQAAGLPATGLVFCNFCRLGRINRQLLGVWVSILKRVPNSVMWLYKHPRSACLRILNTAEQMGIEPGRFIFTGPISPKSVHLQRLTLADLCLDTLVYNGHTTGSDVLWSGVPMVTLMGASWCSRVGGALATAIGLPEMITYSLQEYEELAVKLALNPEMLNDLRQRLLVQREKSPLFDYMGWVRSFEGGLDEVWSSHQTGQARPTVLNVPDKFKKEQPPQ